MAEEQQPTPAQRPPRPCTQLRQSRSLGLLLQVAGTVSAGLGTASGAVAYRSLRTWRAEQGWWAVAVELGLMLCLLAAGRWAIRQGYRHRAPVLSPLTELPEDEAVVLFLRSFADDAGLARVQRGSMRDGPWAASTETEEQQLSRAIAPFGRMVALGRPGDRLPQPGAGRHYSSDLVWQQEVLAALDRASLVLLVCGPGRQLRWEVEQIVARGRPERLVLIGVRSVEQYETFRLAMQDAFPKGLPPSAPARKDRTDTPETYIRDAVWFEADWTPHLVPLGSDDPEIEVLWLLDRNAWVETAFPLAVRPVFLRAGLALPRLPMGHTARPWAVKAAVPLLALAWGVLMAEMARGRAGNIPGVLVFAAVASLLLYRTWLAGQVTTGFLKLYSGLFGTLLVPMSFLDGPLVTGPLTLPVGLGLLTGVLLLSREDVRLWRASHGAYRRPRGAGAAGAGGGASPSGKAGG
ncbi:hypothetical protein [Streptomyces sp. NPDC052036]|uniref:hypothetical protein n=1 Tax=Streptomyces sp. NPDC052036 TaxID=3155171 RepID=UPI003442E68F